MLTLFTTAKAFRGHSAIIQRNALQSWKLLHPDVDIILFGDDEGAAAVCAELGVRHDTDIIVNPSGTKRLDSIFNRAQQLARHNLVCYVNCDIVLTQQFTAALKIVSSAKPGFLMVGRRWDTDVTAPIDFTRPNWQESVLSLAHSSGIQRAHFNIDYFAFPRGLYPEFPPLVIGRIWWDNWLVWRAASLGASVVDVSDVVCAVHQNHDYGYHPQGMTGVWYDEEAYLNLKLAGGYPHLRSIEDARFRLTSRGVRPNHFWWLAGLKRKARAAHEYVGGVFRNRILFPILDFTRPVRHSIGVKQENLIPGFVRRWRERRRWMD